jgi:hypothetical protein
MAWPNCLTPYNCNEAIEQRHEPGNMSPFETSYREQAGNNTAQRMTCFRILSPNGPKIGHWTAVSTRSASQGKAIRSQGFVI